MRLLLTRGAEDAVRTKAKLEAAGHTVMVSPLIEIVATGMTWPHGVVDAVLVASAQPFKFLGRDALPSPEARRLLPLFLVGPHTARVAREHGFCGAAVIAPTATALAAEIEKRPRRKRLAYLAGRQRKPDIEIALGDLNQPFELVEIYEAKATKILPADVAETLKWGAIGGVLHYSRRSAELFLAAAARGSIDVRATSHYCLSDDVAVPLRESGCTSIKVATAPTEIALLERVDAIG